VLAWQCRLCLPKRIVLAVLVLFALAGCGILERSKGDGENENIRHENRMFRW